MSNSQLILKDNPPNYSSVEFNSSSITYNNEINFNILANTVYEISKSGWYKKEYKYLNDQNDSLSFHFSAINEVVRYLKNGIPMILLCSSDYDTFYDEWNINYLVNSKKYKSMKLKKKRCQFYAKYEIEFVNYDNTIQKYQFQASFFRYEWNLYHINPNDFEVNEILLLKYNYYTFSNDKLVVYKELDEEDFILFCLILTFILNHYRTNQRHHDDHPYEGC